MVEDFGKPLIDGFSKFGSFRIIGGLRASGAQEMLVRILSAHQEGVILSQGLAQGSRDEGLQ